MWFKVVVDKFENLAGMTHSTELTTGLPGMFGLSILGKI